MVYINVCRNEEYQEDLWRRSFEFLKEHLSPETVQKYCPQQEVEGSMVTKGTLGEVASVGDCCTEESATETLKDAMS